MKNIEEIFHHTKEEWDQLPVPEELESRLKSALKHRKGKKSFYRRAWKLQAVSIILIVILMGYHYDTLAYYSKKFIGYDQIMNGTLRQLNELGKGQVIDKSYTFDSGITVTLDGIMLDSNRLIVFYTAKDPNGNIDYSQLSSFEYIQGIGGRHHMEGAQGEINEEGTEIRYMADFQPPYFFEKNLTFHFTIEDQGSMKEGKIGFQLDRNKAMKHTLKKNLKKSIEVDETKIFFESIVASPTTTVIKGSLQNIFLLAKDQILGERFRPTILEIDLIANGKPIPTQGGGMSTDMKGITFEREYEALPQDLKNLQIHLRSFAADHDVNQQIGLFKGEETNKNDILGQDILINEVYESKGDTYITITTEESVILTEVYLLIDGEKVELQECLSAKLDKKMDGTITNTRTLHFQGSGNDLQLDIQRMTYKKQYNQIIDIPIE